MNEKISKITKIQHFIQKHVIEKMSFFLQGGSS